MDQNKLTIDAGNTLMKVAVHDGEDFVYYQRKPKISEDEIRQIINKYEIKTAILSSVRKTDTSLIKQLNELDYFLAFTSDTPLPIIIDYESPETLGLDRLAAATGAHSILPEENILIIDAGTCITIDLLTAGGVYKGGSILPGIDMKFKALHNYTGHLPLVSRPKEIPVSGKNTKSSIQSGIMYGTILEIEGFIQDYMKRIADLRIMITGGDLKVFETKLKSKIFAFPKLVATGLIKILEHNDIKA